MRDIDKPFVWGIVIKEYEIGEYQIIRYHPKKFKDGRATGEYDFETTHYHGYIRGKDTNRGWPTLEAAITGLIAYNCLGPNDGPLAGLLFMRMLKKD